MIKKTNKTRGRKSSDGAAVLTINTEALVGFLREHVEAIVKDALRANKVASVGAGSAKSKKPVKKQRKARTTRTESFDDSALEAQVISFLQSSPGSRVDQIIDAVKAKKPDVKRVVARLYVQSKLTRRGKTRGTKYTLAQSE